MRFVITIFTFLLINSAIGQTPFYHPFKDTLQTNYRITHTLDSLDIYLANYQTSLPKFNSFRTQLFNFEENSNKHVLFSSIPHVGLYYSLGSKLTQSASIQYRQLVDTGFYVQFLYTRNSSNGILRTSSFEQNNIDAQFIIQRRKYVNWTKIYFDGNNRALNWGLAGDTVDIDFNLEFQSVERSSNSTTRKFQVQSENYFSFLNGKNKAGLYVNPIFSISNKRFKESNIDFLFYPKINFDSTNTNDYWEKSSIAIKSGIFYEHEKMFFRAGIHSNYWDYDNLISHLDTTEIGFNADGQFSIKNSILKFSFNNTFIGAKGEKNISFKYFLPINKFNLQVKGGFSESFPELNQRNYISNALQINWTIKKLIQKRELNILLNSTTVKIPFSISFSNKQLSNQAFFFDSVYRQDTLTSLNKTEIAFRAEIRWKQFFVQPLLNYSIYSNYFISSYSGFARIGFEGAVLKSKKLKTVIGLEVGYQSEQELYDYNGFVDEYIPIVSSNRFNATPKLHVFNSYDLGFLRWNIRIENIEQTFIKKQNYQALGYPIAPFQFRIGASWDLFN